MKPVSDIRRENLEKIVKEMGTLEAVASIAKSSSIYLSQIRNGALDAKTGQPRGMGNDIARRIEAGAGKPTGWMDQQHDHRLPAETGGYLVGHAPAAAVPGTAEQMAGYSLTATHWRRVADELALQLQATRTPVMAHHFLAVIDLLADKLEAGSTKETVQAAVRRHLDLLT